MSAQPIIIDPIKVATILGKDAAIQVAQEYARQHPDKLVEVQQAGVTIWISTPQLPEVQADA